MKKFRTQDEIYKDIVFAMNEQHKIGYSGLNPSMMPNGLVQNIFEFCEYLGGIAASKVKGGLKEDEDLKEKIKDVARKSIRSPHHTDEEMQTLLIFALDLDELA